MRQRVELTFVAGTLLAVAACSGAAKSSGSGGDGMGGSPDSGTIGKMTDGGTGSHGDTGTRGNLDGESEMSFDATEPPPPTGPIGQVAAAQLLTQGTFGPTLDLVTSVSNSTYDDWFASQAAVPISLRAPTLPTNGNPGNDPQVVWWTIAVNAPDQLRQRMAFALSEILVLGSGNGFDAKDQGTFYDILAKDALGNFRDLLNDVTLSPAMGVYLTYFKNDKANPALNTHADENYAREVMQLFTIGLYELNTDGTQKLSSGNPIATYSQTDVENMARVFTGWASNPIPPHTIANDQGWEYDADYVTPMACYPVHHDTGAKTLLGNVPVPAGGDCVADLKIALDTLFNHPNVGPFIGKQLIQRLVTSNPSPGYVTRVAAAFDNDGTGVRGNLLAVAKAILTDVEARTPGTGTGKLREPMLRITEMWRAFSAADQSPSGGSVLDLSTADATQATVDEYGATVMGYNYWDEAALSSPSVFNFFRPDYLRAGPLEVAGLVAPEMQITTEATVVTMLTYLEALAYQYVDSKGTVHSGPDNYTTPTSAGSVLLHTAEWEPFAADPATLADKLNTVFMSGAMPSELRDQIVTFITPLTDPAERVINANYLMMFSPQYSVQR